MRKIALAAAAFVCLMPGAYAQQITIVGGGVTSIVGTTNQIVASAAAGPVTLSLSTTLIAPGSLEVTSASQIDGAGAASLPSLLIDGALFTGGNGTTTFPQFYISATGTAAITSFSTAGTYFGVNAVTGFAGNFLDFHTAGGSSLFAVGSGGTIVTNGGLTALSGTIAAGVLQSATLRGGAAASSTIVIESTSGTGTTDSMALKTGSQSTFLNADTNGLITVPKIGPDTTHTDATICEDTTTHALYAGAGTIGICLGTSSLRFKHDIGPLMDGIVAVMALKPIHYKLNKDHGDPNKVLYGFGAEDVVNVLPKLVGLDRSGKPNSVDLVGMIPVLVRALQQEETQIRSLTSENVLLQAENAAEGDEIYHINVRLNRLTRIRQAAN